MLSETAKPIATRQVSLAIFAWNEERSIGGTLESLFQQSFFGELEKRGLKCEILCVVNGCSDRTPDIAEKIFSQQRQNHPDRGGFSARVANLPERGKVNAWNQFVHSLSAKESQYLFMMDADIVMHRPETLWKMFSTLESDPQASVTTDVPCKDIQFKPRKSLRERLSLGASRATLSAPAQLCGQLYGIRAEVARNIFLPKDLAACEDGFIKALVCTDFLTHPVTPERLRVAEGAEHTFEAYTSVSAILKNQKRQIIGQTIVHLLVDDYLKSLPLSQRLDLAATLREKDLNDPMWLKRLIAAHLRRTRFFWKLYPGICGQRLKRLRGLSLGKKLRLFPAAAAGFCFSFIPAFLAHTSLKRGVTDYWPAKTPRPEQIETQAVPAWQLTPTSNKPRLKI
jgi:glycosyltransferase involved in cell wall biosynthesis